MRKMTTPNKVLHIIFALCALIQLFSSLIMNSSIMHHGHLVPEYTITLYNIHLYNGLFTFIIIFIYLANNVFDSEDRKLHLFPIFYKKGLQTVQEDLALLFKGYIPERSSDGGLAGFIQGLGALLLFFVALLGTIYYFTDIKIMKDLHKDFADIVWFYLGGHVGMFVLHFILKSRVKKVG